MTNWIDMIGSLNYSPKRLGDHVSKNWWITVECDKELGKYLRHLYYLYNYKTEKLIRSAWAEHISVVRNEEPPTDHYKSFWEKYARAEIWVRIYMRPETNGEYWWLPAYSEAALNIRQELGLSREPEIPLHMTFGHKG